MTGSQILGVCILFAAGAFFISASQTADNAAVQLRWNEKGLASIQFGGREYLSFGEFVLSRLTFVDSKDNPNPAFLQATVRVDPASQSIRLLYPWGSIQSRITAVRNMLEISIEIANNSRWRIKGLALEPLRLRFDQKPSQYDGSIPILADSITNPRPLIMSTPDESIVLANEDPTKPLSIGFPWALNKPADTNFPSA